MEALPTLELSVLEEVCAGNSELLRAVLVEYLKTAPNSILSMSEFLARDDLSQACRAAHSLKGGSRAIGADRLGQLCERLESASDSASAQLFLAEIQSEYRHIETAIADVLSEPPLGES
jgi:HPt (histidine-containing phosphotransfer) domain-containing protein